MDSHNLYAFAYRQYGCDHYVVVWAKMVDALRRSTSKIFPAGQRLGYRVFYSCSGHRLLTRFTLDFFVDRVRILHLIRQSERNQLNSTEVVK